MKFDLKFGVITVISKTLDLCDVAKQAQLDCPIQSGNHTAKLTVAIPSIAPKVKFKSNYIVLYNIYCMHYIAYMVFCCSLPKNLIGTLYWRWRNN